MLLGLLSMFLPAAPRCLTYLRLWLIRHLLGAGEDIRCISAASWAVSVPCDTARKTPLAFASVSWGHLGFLCFLRCCCPNAAKTAVNKGNMKVCVACGAGAAVAALGLVQKSLPWPPAGGWGDAAGRPRATPRLGAHPMPWCPPHAFVPTLHRRQPEELQPGCFAGWELVLSCTWLIAKINLGAGKQMASLSMLFLICLFPMCLYGTS